MKSELVHLAKTVVPSSDPGALIVRVTGNPEGPLPLAEGFERAMKPKKSAPQQHSEPAAATDHHCRSSSPLSIVFNLLICRASA